MNADNYSIARLVADVEQVCAKFKDDREIVVAVRPLARRVALSKKCWLEERLYQANAGQGFGVHLLHEKPDHTLAIFAVSWLPHRGTPPHDHGTWAVVVGVDGPEKNQFFERTDDGSRPGYAELKKVGEKVCREGDVLAMHRGVIHSVWNETDAVTVSLHIYGKHINYTGRSQFDLERKTETPFTPEVGNVKMVARNERRAMPNSEFNRTAGRRRWPMWLKWQLSQQRTACTQGTHFVRRAAHEAVPPSAVASLASYVGRRIIMATYIVLTSFTDQGIRGAKDTTKRADSVKELAKKFGVTAKEFFWTLGSYDVIAIFEAPDDASMTALGLAIGAAGNVRTQTLRAFSREEMNKVLAKLA